MRTLLVLLDKEFRQFFRNPFLPKMAVAFPMMVMLVIPWITTMDVRHVGVSVVDNDRSTASRRLVGKIGASDYFRLYGVTEHYGASLAALERGDVDVIVEIPDDFERSIAERSPRRVSITANGVNALKGSLGSQYMVQTVMGTLAELLAEEGVAPSPDLITVQNRYNPTLDYRAYMIPALMIMLLIMLCGFLPALNLVGEKERGTIEQINVTPVGRLTFTLAKLIPYWIIGLAVLTVAMSLAWLRTDARRRGRCGLSGRRALHRHDVGTGRGDRQSIRYDAADDVRDVFLRDDLRADERTDYPDRVDARLGAGDHAASPDPLFHRDHACGLSQRYGARGTVGRLCGAGRFRPCLWYVGYTDLQETDVGPQSAWKRVFR